MSKLYLPQDMICFCGHRIGNHSQHELWSHLEKSTKALRQIKSLTDGVNSNV